MRFLFKADDAQSRGLRVISEIPDVRLARIEGRNGIGKTLAARLLELVSGEQPFAALPRAWESLVELLGRVEIRIVGLPQGDIVAELDSVRWQGKSQEECAKDPGIVTIGGELAQWDRVRELIQVRRVAGDEGLAETLARTLRERAIEAEGSRRQFGAIVEAWSLRLESLQALCGEASPERLHELRDAADRKRLDYSAARRELLADERLADAWQTVSSRAEAAKRVADNAPRLLRSYRASLEVHQAATDKIRDLEQQLAEAGAASVLDENRKSQIAKWTRLLELRGTAHTRARVQEQRALGYLGLKSRTTASELSRLQRDVESQVKVARNELKTADLSGEVRSAARVIEGALTGLPESAHDQTIADLDRPVRVNELLEGIVQRRLVLEGIPRPGEAQALAGRISLLEYRTRVLSRLPALTEITDRKYHNVEAAEAELATLMGLTDQQRVAREVTQAALAGEREAMVRGSAESVASLSAIYDLLGAPPPDFGATIDALDADLDEDDEESFSALGDEMTIGVEAILKPADDLVSDVEQWFDNNMEAIRQSSLVGDLGLSWPLSGEAQSTLHELSVHAQNQQGATRKSAAESRTLTEAFEEESAATRMSLNHQRASIALAIVTIRDESGPWQELHTQFNELMRRAGLAPDAVALTPDGFLGEGLDTRAAELAEDRSAHVLHVLSDLAESIEDAAARVRDAWGTASAFLLSETRRMAPRLADADPEGWTLTSLGSSRIGLALREWTEDEIGGILASGALRAQLFDNAESVSFDLSGLAVQWRTRDGKRRRRPLEAFSSGEQVFAYTKAKLETFRPLRARTERVVVFLDEFGAFVARDRFSELMRYVSEEVMEAIADQVVVMLPSSSIDQTPLLQEGLDGFYQGDGYVVTSAEPESPR